MQTPKVKQWAKVHILSDSRLSEVEKRLYIIDCTIITLFSTIPNGAGRNPKHGKKGGITHISRMIE